MRDRRLRGDRSTARLAQGTSADMREARPTSGSGEDRLARRAAAGDRVAQVDLAALLDRRGEHHAAVDWLARAAGGRHAPALRLLGLRLATARNAPSLPIEGAGMIREAAALGDPEAQVLAALFAAAGHLEPQSWPTAFALLAMARDGGSGEAREQLAAIGAVANAPAALAAWRACPVPRILSEAPRVISFPGLVPPAMAKALIAATRGRLVQARVFDPVSGQDVVEATRTNRVATLPLFGSSVLSLLVQQRLAAAAGVDDRMLEAATILNYQPGEQARPHHDFIDPAAPRYAEEMARHGQRIATILLYLSEDYQGGETVFPALGLSYRGATGDALVFFSVDAAGSPDRRTVHAGLPPSRGEKWLMSQFVRDRAQR